MTTETTNPVTITAPEGLPPAARMLSAPYDLDAHSAKP